MRQNQCDHCKQPTLGETRLLPSADNGGNYILCFQCFAKEMKFCRGRNEDDKVAGRPELWVNIPQWEDLDIYEKATVSHVNKITVGYVVQKYDPTTRLCMGQKFIAGDEVTYENLDGDHIDWCEVPDELQKELDTHHYQPFNMEQPVKACEKCGSPLKQ